MGQRFRFSGSGVLAHEKAGFLLRAGGVGGAARLRVMGRKFVGTVGVTRPPCLARLLSIWR
jgi:hypothetical protein